MERIVYIIGAGFSAPLGLPVMSNFLMKSKDMYFSNPNTYEYFNDIFKTIEKMSTIKNYYNADLFNIEEILSILEMNEYLDGSNNSSNFKKYISDVIQYYTPDIKKYPDRYPGNWGDFIFGNSDIFRRYGYFVGNILNLRMYRDSADYNIWCSVIKKPQYKYSIVTLNYDLIFENIKEHLDNNFYKDFEFGFGVELNNENEYNPHSSYLAKIHGCVKSGNIIPPTWNKNSNNNLLPTWKLAIKLLEEANHVRILGYSLPITDSYIKYLLKSSILKSSHLKTIDVLTLDPYGDVKERYDNFIEFKYYRFKNANINEYLNKNLSIHKDLIKLRDKEIKFNYLERAHEEFMNDGGN